MQCGQHTIHTEEDVQITVNDKRDTEVTDQREKEPNYLLCLVT
jgi:hypothetical protein